MTQKSRPFITDSNPKVIFCVPNSPILYKDFRLSRIVFVKDVEESKDTTAVECLGESYEVEPMVEVPTDERGRK